MLSEIPPSDVYAILAGLARRQLGLDPAHSRELDAYLHHEADLSAQGLLQHTTIELKLNQYGLDLRQALQRGAVQAWQALHQPRPVFEQLPTRCPACAGLLLGNWRCELCSLELLRWQLREPKEALDSMGVLPWQHLLLPDPRRRRVVVLKLSPQPEVVWQVNFAAEVCEQPCSVRLLPGPELLIADRTGKVLICNLFGEKLWQANLPLKEPVFVNASLDGQFIYIADKGTHQVLVLKRDQEVIWQYGIPGTPGRDEGHLDHPTCVQPTADGTWLIADSGNHRVIEISGLSRKLRRILASDAKLESPMFCEQLPDGETMILDAANYRLLELDASHQLADSCLYYQNHLDSRYKLNELLSMLRRENGNIVLSNAERVIEINPSQKRLLWFSLLTDLRPPATFVKREAAAEKSPTLAATRLQTPFKLMDALRQVPVFEDAPPAFFEKIKLCLRFDEHPAGKLLLREGQRGDSMYMIREGQIEVIKDFQTIAMLGPGDIFGEMALLNSEPRTANVRVATNARVYKLNRLAFESVIQAFPEVHERIRKLAEARQQVLQPAQVETAKERLSKLMESHKQRLADMRERRQTGPRHHQLLEGPLHWKLRYSPLEQHLIQEARVQNYRCFELHVRLHHSCRMKSVRVSLLVMNLEKHGEIIKTHPLPEDILQEKVDQEVVLTILTRSSRVRVLEDAGGVAEIDDIKAVPVQF
ncbi:MAG TPA: cyclic nucleotide-binding domain-containing protein [Candidatus Obscuribacterales bacterium]